MARCSSWHPRSASRARSPSPVRSSRADLTALSPVTVMEVPQELTYSGTVRIEDLVTTMPQAFAGQNSTVANGASGTATIDLRQLGTYRTLVLINGRRLPPGRRIGRLRARPQRHPRAADQAGRRADRWCVDHLRFRRGGRCRQLRHGHRFRRRPRRCPVQLLQPRQQQQAGPGDQRGRRFRRARPDRSGTATAINANVALGGKFADGKGHASVYLDYRKIDAAHQGRARLLSTARSGDRCDGPVCGGSVDHPVGPLPSYDANGDYHRRLRPDWQDDGRRRPLVRARDFTATSSTTPPTTTSSVRTRSGTPAPSPTTRSTSTSTCTWKSCT